MKWACAWHWVKQLPGSLPYAPGTYRLQFPQEGVLQCPLPGRLGHMQVEAVPPAQGVQAEDESHVVLEQAGICGSSRS